LTSIQILLQPTIKFLILSVGYSENLFLFFLCPIITKRDTLSAKAIII